MSRRTRSSTRTVGVAVRTDWTAASMLGWGPWQPAGRRTAGLGEADRARLRRMGFETLASERGLELCDAACELGEPQLVCVELDFASLRAQARAGLLPPVMRTLV